MSSFSIKKIGYLVPEFPGQTHIFFWREIKRLKRLGVEPVVFSTRPPSKTIVCHDWSTEAAEACRYLLPTSISSGVRILKDVIGCGPFEISRVRRLLREIDPNAAKDSKVCWGLIAAAAALVDAASREGIEHVHVHSCGRSALIGLLAQAMGGPTYSITLHGPLYDYGPAQTGKWSHSRFAIVITEKLKAQVEETLDGYLPPRLAVAPMGVDTDVFRRHEPYRPWTGEGPIRLFSCGRLNPCKGHEDLIRAVALLKQCGFLSELSIAGADDGDGSYRIGLLSLAEELEVSDCVNLLGPVDEKVILQELLTAHIFTLASLHEPLGVAIMEAMALEMPVVVTAAGGVRELVDHEVDGLMVPPQSPVDLAGAVERLAQDPALCEKLGRSAAQKVQADFDSAVSAELLLHLIQETSNPALSGSVDPMVIG